MDDLAYDVPAGRTVELRAALGIGAGTFRIENISDAGMNMARHDAADPDPQTVRDGWFLDRRGRPLSARTVVLEGTDVLYLYARHGGKVMVGDG